MSRRRRPEKREILPDPKFNDQILSKFMNNLMLDGKKSVAESIVYGAMETMQARAKAKEAGQNSHVIPLKFVSYEERIGMEKDAKAGGVEVQVDNSVVVVERKDAVAGRQNLIFSTPQRPQVLSWDVGEIRFHTPAAGGTEVGPFRVGEIFAFEGKEFAVVGREGKKIQLQHRSDPDKGKDFWVPPEVTAVPAP